VVLVVVESCFFPIQVAVVLVIWGWAGGLGSVVSGGGGVVGLVFPCGDWL